MRFSRDTALRANADGWHGSIVPGWVVLGNANGGYLMAILGRAAIESSGRPDVVTLSAEFHSPGRVGDIVVTSDELRAGKRFSSTRISMRGNDRLIISGTVQTGDLSTFAGPSLLLSSPSEIPPPGDCLRSEPAGTFPPTLRRPDRCANTS